MSLTRVLVSLPKGEEDRSYEIVIDPGDGSALASEVARAFPGASLGLISDSHVGPLHGQRVKKALEAGGAKVVYVEVPAGEASKSLATVEKVAQALVEKGLTRASALLALGGGVIGDLTGFVASIFLRGVPYAQLPTTLLAQVDSSVGGKTAVDLAAGKNLIGSFWQPRLVYADLSLLATLPARELSAGLAELLKHGAIGDAGLFARMDSQAEVARRGDRELLAELVAWSCRIKAQVVGDDERETASDGAKGRARLNFGHTIGHAIEAASLETQDPLRHGEAVALGMVAAARVGAKLGVGDAELEARLQAILPRLGLPIDVDAWLRPEVLGRIAVDKKQSGAFLKYVVVPKVGAATTVALQPERLVELLLDEKTR